MLISGNVSVAANTRSANLIAGEPFEFLSRSSVVSVYLSGSAAGFTGDFYLGGATLAYGAVVAPTNRTPLREEDGFVQGGGIAGARLFLAVLNTTAGALTINWLIDVQPV